MSPLIVFYSTKSGNTKKFVESLEIESVQIPLKWDDQFDIIDRPFVLITPSYGGGEFQGSVPLPVIKFLNVEENRRNIIATISTGNRTFGNAFCLAGKIISRKCLVPNLLDVEISGTAHDVIEARKKITNLYL